MLCNKCGKEVPNEWSFCNYCGNQIKCENEGNEKKGEKWKKYVKEFFTSKIFIIYTIIIVLVILLNLKYSNISALLFLGIWIYLTVLILIILPMWMLWKYDKNLTNNQNEIKIEEKVNKEYRKKCNVCGYIFCYTDEDIIANNEKIKLANRYRIGMVTQGLMGNNKIDWRYNQEKMEQSLSQIIDFSKCFKCGSTDIIDYDNEKQNEENASISDMDEIIKYKELLDKGILTKEEFDKKKKELLKL